MAKDFSQGKIWKNIISQSIPLIMAQFVLLAYNVVDRIYIGHLGAGDSMALTGIGLVFPISTLIAAFTFLYGTGGNAIFSISRGEGNKERAEKIMGNTFTMLLCTSFVLLAACYMFRRPIMYAFGASDDSYIYANEYLRIYLLGTVFCMISSGLNGFINAQGYPKTGMLTTVIGAVLNIALDPVFIFGLNMGVSGAALATVISQFVSCIWVLRFLTGRKVQLQLKPSCMRLDYSLSKRIVTLGFAGFVMQATNCLVQVACNSMLSIYGGDLYVGIMTVINSVREILSLPVMGLTSGAQPVIGFNYGAHELGRVKEAIRFMSKLGMAYTLAAWLIVLLIPHLLMSVFTDQTEMIETGAAALKLYFFGFFFMSFQFAGQATFTAVGDAKHAIFFSLFRKAVIVTPLTVLLPQLGFGVNGVYIAEPVSNGIGGLACFLTMYFTIYKKLISKDSL